MADFHHNIYYFYRGASQSDFQLERQLEDNTTKALINTLEHCTQSVAQRFLNWLGIVGNDKPHFELQRKSIGDAKISAKSQKLLLGIVPSKRIDNSDARRIGNRDDSRPDAWIYGDDYVVLIESKIVENLDSAQMAYHKQKLQPNKGAQVQSKVKTWAEVHCFFITLLPDLNEKNRWLVSQFVQYLERISMADFAGFSPEVFDYFIKHDDEDVRKWIKNVMEGFAEKVQPQLYKMDSFYDSYDLGRLELKQAYSWIAFGPKDRKYRQWAHQTISVNSNGIEVFINVELKSATDKLKVVSKTQKNKFRGHLTSLALDGPISIQIEERTQKQAMVYDYKKIATIELNSLKNNVIGKNSFEYLEAILEQLPFPYFSIRKLIDREDACKLSQKDQGKSLINEVVRICKEFHPIVSFINK